MDAWADWVRRYRDYNGAPSTSIAYRMMQAKLLGVSAFGTAIEPEMPAQLAAVDQAVGRLPRRHKRAFKTYYLWYASSEDKAARCRCSVAEFYRRLREARQSVAQFIAFERIAG